MLLKHLKELAFFMEYGDENFFKIRAIKAAREILEGLQADEIHQRIEAGTLTELKGIGKGIAGICSEFSRSGSSKDWKAATKGLPLSLIELTKIRGLGIRKIKSIYEQLGVSNISELEYACEENRLASLESFGKKYQEKILKEIFSLKANQNKLLLSDALEETKKFEAKFPEKLLFAPIGDLGKKMEIVECFEYLLVPPAPKKLPALIQDLSQTKLHKSKSVSKDIRFHTKNGQEARFVFCSKEEFAISRIFHTSSAAHWEALEKKAISKKLNLTSMQLKKDKKIIPIESEDKLYQELGLAYYPPEAREYRPTSSFEFVKLQDVHGAFHTHTTYSDGRNSLSEMVAAAQKRSWSYIGLSDHSQSSSYANGLKKSELEKQWQEMKSTSTKVQGFRIFRGIESDILKKGELDYPESILKKFDFVIASIHQRYGLKDMTERIINAIRNPYTTMIGHISGRLLLGRNPYELSYEKVIREAIQSKTIIEFNCNPHRMDIDWRFLNEACQQGLLISLNPDAHSTEGLDNVEFGVWMANKAQVEKKQILNTWSAEEIDLFFIKNKKAA